MLRRISNNSGLEYSAPARGTWNIVHTGMLIPEAHQIFVCASGCLRGVVLTAAEMNAQDRFSTIEIKENNVLEGDMESLITDGVTDILKKLPKMPPAVLLYTSCIHHFMGCDMAFVFKTLRERFPETDFTDCYMNPIMRKSGPDPDQIMRRQLYSLLTPARLNEKKINIIGNDFATDKTSELVKIIEESGHTLSEITDFDTYDGYKTMSESALNITYYPPARIAGEALEKRLGQKHLFLPISYDYDEIKDNIDTLSKELGAVDFDHKSAVNHCEEKAEALHKMLGDTPIAIDYTATPRPFGLALYLVRHGFNVKRVYADSVSPLDKSSFENLTDIEIYPTVNPKMRVLSRDNPEFLCIGQKAAYFTGSSHFVNMIEGGGHWGYDGIIRILSKMEDAFLHEKDTRQIIQVKGWGCGCC